MTYLAIGAGFLFLFMIGIRAFLSADPVVLAKVLRWSLITVSVFLALLLFFRGQALLAAAPAAVAAISWRLLRVVPMGLWFRLFQMGRARSRQRRYAASASSRAAGGGERSTVESEWLRMTLDHATGDLSGEVVKGPFSGQQLDDMDEESLQQLFGECCADESTVQLLESYIDRRLGPDWRDTFAKDGSSQRPNSSDMGRDEAYKILGLARDSSEAEIKEAHKKLMINNHPDHGGSAYLATKINRARDVLLDELNFFKR